MARRHDEAISCYEAFFIMYNPIAVGNGIFFMGQALVMLLSFIGTVYPESIRGTLVQDIFIELLSKRSLSEQGLGLINEIV